MIPTTKGAMKIWPSKQSVLARRYLGILIFVLIFIVAGSNNVLARDSLSRVTTKNNIFIKVNPHVFINNNFYGFGVETLPWLWTRENEEAGVNAEDIKFNLQRIREMRLPITRIFVPWETWNPSVDYQTFTWESDEMRSLYKTLDVYQETKTKVILVTVDWLKDPPWKNVKASAGAVLKLLEYLVKVKGYSCIQFWTLTNEPELTYGWLNKMPFENYVQIHRWVRKGLKARKLSVEIIVSDDVECNEWFQKSLQSLHKVADIFDSHLYLYPRQINTVPDFFRERLTEIKRTSKRNIPFFLCEFGFRGTNFSSCVNNIMGDYEYGLYVADLCIVALNSGVDSASLWCLHQIRLINKINPEGGKMMRIGLWAYKDKQWQPFPIFYLYSLFTRYIKSNSKIVKVEVSSPDTLKAACVEYAGNYSIFITNLTDQKENFFIEGINSNKDFIKYIYTKSRFPVGGNNPLKIESQVRIKGYLEDTIPAQSVILYTNL